MDYIFHFSEMINFPRQWLSVLHLQHLNIVLYIVRDFEDLSKLWVLRHEESPRFDQEYIQYSKSLQEKGGKKMSHKQILKAEERGWSDVRHEKEYKQPLKVKVKKWESPIPQDEPAIPP